MSEGSGESAQQGLKKSFHGVFVEHDRRSELMDQNQPKRKRRLIMFGKVWHQ